MFRSLFATIVRVCYDKNTVKISIVYEKPLNVTTLILNAPYGCKMSYVFLKRVKISIIFKNKQNWVCICCQLHVVGINIAKFGRV